jgi:hypothetical protein
VSARIVLLQGIQFFKAQSLVSNVIHDNKNYSSYVSSWRVRLAVFRSV